MSSNPKSIAVRAAEDPYSFAMISTQDACGVQTTVRNHRKEKVVMNYEIALYCRVSREKKGTTLHAFHSSVLVALLQN